MASTEKELEEQLREAGSKLLDPPSPIDELLSLLDHVDNCLSRVEQSPTQSTQDAISPALKALIGDKLFKHSDVDVKVAVASCISEITRITAPDAPYEDDQMKEVFQLIVSSFENLHDTTSRSFTKRTSILETVAKVRSCVVMLDLECDAMILEMFQHFLKSIRDHHPENVYSSMETIMTLVLEESEEIPLELLSPILSTVKKDNEEVLPIARKLGERVLESCANKLKPFLLQAVNTLGISLDDYSNVVASICQDTAGSLGQNDVCATTEHAGDEGKSEKKPLEESAQAVREDGKEESAPPQQDNLVGDKSPKSVMSNGIAQVGEDDALVDSKSLKKQGDTDCSMQSKGIDLQSKEEPNDLDTGKADNIERKAGQVTKKRGRKASTSAKLTGPSEGLHLANEKEAEKIDDSKGQREEVPSSPQGDGCVEAAGPSENDKEIDSNISSPKAGDGESDVASPPPSENRPEENRSKKLVRAKKKDSTAKEMAPEDVSKKVFEGTSDSEAKASRRSVKKTLDRSSDVRKATVVDSAKKGSGTSIDQDAKKHSARKAEESKKGNVGSSSKQSEDKKKRGRGKLNVDVAARSSTKDEKEKVSLPKIATKPTKDEQSEETPKTNLKRKRTPGKENVKYDQSLVGTRVKVYWPEDDQYYKGVIDFFDRATKKHRVSYDDGDKEVLVLKEEKWEFINEDADSDREEGSDHKSPDASADMPPKKKGKSSAGESTKGGKKGASSRSGGATSSKSKGSSIKSSVKSKDGSKADRKSKDQTPKSGGSKSVDAAQKVSGKSKNTDGSKISKSKDDDVSMPKSSKSKQGTLKTGRTKQETSKTASASKAKSSKSGGKSNTNGTGKMKFSLSQAKDSDSENSEDSTEEMEEDNKGKTTISSKAGSEAKSGKKRSRNTISAGKVKSNILQAKDSETENSEDSTKEMEEDTKGKTTISLKAGGEAKSGKKSGRNTIGTGKVKSNLVQAKDSETDNSEDSTKEMEEDTKIKTTITSKAGSEAKSGKKRGRN